MITAKQLAIGPPPLRFDRVKSRVVRFNWPMADCRGIAIFSVRRENLTLARVVRELGGKVKSSPAARRVGIATGTDGKTYILGEVDKVTRFIMPGTMRFVLTITEGEELFDEIGISLC